MKQTKDKKQKHIFNVSLIESFREKINSSKIFTEDEIIKSKMNLIYAVLDRVDTCVKVINKHNLFEIKDEEEFLLYFTCASMLRDAIILLFKEIAIPYSFDKSKEPQSHEFFGKLYTTYRCLHNSNISGELYQKENDQFGCTLFDCNTPKCPQWQNDLLDDCPTDDKFFEYLRSLIFAHPFNTDRPKFFLDKETQYCPWVTISKFMENDKLIIRIYSNKFDGMLDLRIPFDSLNGYIKSRYNLLNYAIGWADKEITKYKQKWAKRKVNRNLAPIEILQDIKSILQERFEDSYSIEKAIAYLTCPITEACNSRVVEKYRKYLIENIPALCDSIDSMDETVYENNAFINALYIRPKKIHQQAHYQLEKIFSYLSNGEKLDNIHAFYDHVYLYSRGIEMESNAEWGILQAMQFYEDLAKSYVLIKPEMPYTEIKLLVNCACYLECKNQECGTMGSALKATIEKENKKE